MRVEKAARREQMLQRYERQRVRNRFARPGRFPYVLVLDGLKAGYNVAKIFRSALALGASTIHLVDIGPFDPAPAKGAFRKVPACFHDDFVAARRSLANGNYQWFALTPHAEAILTATPLPERSAFVFGHEELGLSFSLSDHLDILPLRIPQIGATESLNVSVAASIVMYEYLRQHGS